MCTCNVIVVNETHSYVCATYTRMYTNGKYYLTALTIHFVMQAVKIKLQYMHLHKLKLALMRRRLAFIYADGYFIRVLVSIIYKLYVC